MYNAICCSSKNTQKKNNLPLHDPGSAIPYPLKTKVLTDVKFIYSEKTTKFCEIFALLLTCTTYDKSKVKISKDFVALSE